MALKSLAMGFLRIELRLRLLPSPRLTYLEPCAQWTHLRVISDISPRVMLSARLWHFLRKEVRWVINRVISSGAIKESFEALGTRLHHAGGKRSTC